MAVDNSYGYGGDGGSIDEKAWALATPSYGSQPGVITPIGEAVGLTLTVVDAASRTVTLTAGKACGWGILDVLSDTALSLAEYTGTTQRWDAICLHRDWQATPNGLTTVTIVQGTGSMVPPVGLSSQPGVVADQLLWLVKVTPTGIADQRQVSPSIGQVAYYPSITDNGFLRPQDYRYGSIVAQYGTPSKLLLRRGGVGSEVFEDLLDPAWTDVQPFSTMANINAGRKLGMRVRGGMLEIRGTMVPAGGGTFDVGGGTDNDYDICVVPSGMRPAASRVSGPGSNAASLQLSYDSSDNRLKARFYTAPSGFIFLDGTAFSL